jgi:hypothetical protein
MSDGLNSLYNGDQPGMRISNYFFISGSGFLINFLCQNADRLEHLLVYVTMLWLVRIDIGDINSLSIIDYGFSSAKEKIGISC